jgi:hypothetical protein
VTASPWYANAALLGVERALEPPGALPHIARRLDAAAPEPRLLVW